MLFLSGAWRCSHSSLPPPFTSTVDLATHGGLQHFLTSALALNSRNIPCQVMAAFWGREELFDYSFCDAFTHQALDLWLQGCNKAVPHLKIAMLLCLSGKSWPGANGVRGTYLT